ncbi:MAG: acetyltransferase [Syntrophobacteraceae bacterium]
MHLGIIGYGLHGKHIEALAIERYPEAQVTFFDDPAVEQGVANAYPFADWRKECFAALHFIVALGYNHPQLRVRIIRELIASGRAVPALVHPSAFVSRHAKLGSGVVVATMSTVAPHCTLEEGVFLSTAVVVSHHARIGSGCYIGPGAVLAGSCDVGQYTFIGSGSTIGNDRRIGRECRIGMASAITHDVPDGKSAIGSPMRILDHQLRL